MEAINSEIDSKKNNKSSSRSKSGPQRVQEIQRVDPPITVNTPPILSSPDIPFNTANQTHPFPGANDELTDMVVEVVSSLEKYQIIPPIDYSFRLATPDDVDTILSLIRELAIYEQSVESLSMTREILLRDGWGIGRKYPTSPFRPDFYVYLVDFGQGDSRTTVGMALFYQVYSTWKGRSIHLEDLFVQEDHRAHGLGSLLMRLVGAVVHEMKMSRYQWVCLTWNEKPRQFYGSLGTSELNEWVTIRMEDNVIEKFVYFGRGDAPIDSSTSTVNTTAQIPHSSVGPTSWNDRFAQARKVCTRVLRVLLYLMWGRSGMNVIKMLRTSIPSKVELKMREESHKVMMRLKMVRRRRRAI
jgi:GNAT superfamily N-acetyltransferase